MRAVWWVILALGCGDNLTAEEVHPDATGTHPRFEPWVVGAEWVYRLSNGIKTGEYKTTVRDETAIVGGPHDGARAFLVHAEKLDGSKDVYEAYRGDLDIRYRSIFYDLNGLQDKVEDYGPFRLKLDESPAHTTVGATYVEQFTQTYVRPGGMPITTLSTDTWKVIDDDVPITVPAGTFTALHVQRNNRKNIQDYWYAPGVGKLKETGGDQIEELVSYSIPSP